MKTENMSLLIQSLGCSHEELVVKQLISDRPLLDLYQDGETLEAIPENGVVLTFWPERLRFVSIYINLDSTNDTPHYSGVLPKPFTSLKTKRDVRETLGVPLYSKTQRELQGSKFTDWDTYQLPTNLHPAALAEILYKSTVEIGSMQFSVIDKNV